MWCKLHRVKSFLLRNLTKYARRPWFFKICRATEEEKYVARRKHRGLNSWYQRLQPVIYLSSVFSVHVDMQLLLCSPYVRGASR